MGNADEAARYMHPDSPDTPIRSLNAWGISTLDVTVESAVVEDRDDDIATVQVVVSDGTEGDGRAIKVFRYELQTDGKEWRVYEDLKDVRGEQDLPLVLFRSQERTNDIGEVTEVTFTHVDGEGLSFSSLFVTAFSARAFPSTVRTATTVRPGDGVVARLDAPGGPQGKGARIELLWSAPETDLGRRIAVHELQAEAVGDLWPRIDIAR